MIMIWKGLFILPRFTLSGVKTYSCDHPVDELRNRFLLLHHILARVRRMDFSDCVKFATENPVTFIATAEGDQPRVRAFAMWFADATGFYYHTGTPKAVWRQLTENPKVELCFYAPGDVGKMLRVTGTVEFLDDAALKERLIGERPWLLQIGLSGPNDPKLAVFRVAHGEAHFWTMENNMREAEAPRVRF